MGMANREEKGIRNSEPNISKNFILNKSKIFWILFSFLFLWLIIIRPENNISKLRKEGQEIKGRIYRKSAVGSKGTIRCFYIFDLNGKVYEGFYDNPKLNKWDSIEIIYYIKDPNLNQAKQFVKEY
jgi:hypothetical protein